MKIWMTYCDPSRLCWDVAETDDVGATGSNWMVTTEDAARAFADEMQSPESVEEGWFRGHYWAPRF